MHFLKNAKQALLEREMSKQEAILFAVAPGKGGDVGIITLNRPAVLNALDDTMIKALDAALKAWAIDETIKAVVIRAAEGRAFCAGGDLRLLYKHCLKSRDEAAVFFRDEYQLNRFIFHFPKPYIAFLDGITMGGGVGISIHGSHRVATERLLFAMPETSIGFFPDIGGNYFLPRLPGKMGYYLGLTGVKINSDDCVALNIAQQKVASKDLDALLSSLIEEAYGDDKRKAVTNIIQQFEVKAERSHLLVQQDLINKVFAAPTIEEMMQHQIAKEAFANKSPTSLKVTLRALQQGEELDFDACMQQDYRLACRFLEGHDFMEGIRALIVDKDLVPVWHPASLQEVSAQAVEAYFSPIADELAV